LLNEVLSHSLNIFQMTQEEIKTVTRCVLCDRDSLKLAIAYLLDKRERVREGGGRITELPITHSF